ncbi:MAG: PLP-dependent aminotransferase family protein [Lentisphaeria bacterium]|nr:PLP-dependent aminotransferase family protein [Lentisphaeria bacterium]
MDYNKMPTNSFETFHLSWIPEKKQLTKPCYLALANALEADILSGKLAAGTRLPPQRELADYLDINFTTVTRAYTLCRERKLIYGEVGRGTYVSPLPGTTRPGNTGNVIELGIVNGFDHLRAPVIEATAQLLQKSYLNQLYSYAEPAGHLHQRAAGAHWMTQMDVRTDSEHTAIFSGAQNAISTALLSLFRIGDKMAVDEYTYSNLIGTAKLSHIQLIPVKGDESGMLPDHLDFLCQKHRIRGLFLMPNCANPTTRTLTEQRKDALADTAQKFGLTVIEDDNTGASVPLANSYHSLFSRLPEQTLYICNATMALCSGLRVAFAAFPEKFRPQLLEALFHLNIKTSSLDAEIMTELILSGKAKKILEQKRFLAEERNKIFDRIFPQAPAPGSKGAFFRWLPLQNPCKSGMDMERDLRDMGVNVYHAYRFTVNRNPGHFFRFAISSPETNEALAQGLDTVRRYLEQ